MTRIVITGIANVGILPGMYLLWNSIQYLIDLVSYDTVTAQYTLTVEGTITPGFHASQSFQILIIASADGTQNGDVSQFNYLF